MYGDTVNAARLQRYDYLFCEFYYNNSRLVVQELTGVQYTFIFVDQTLHWIGVLQMVSLPIFVTVTLCMVTACYIIILL